MQEEKEVKIYIETTLAGPCVKDGWYAAILVCRHGKEDHLSPERPAGGHIRA